MFTTNAKKLTSFLSALLLVIGANGLSACATIEGAGNIFKALEKPLKKAQKKLQTNIVNRAVYR